MPRHRTLGVTAVALAIAALIGVNVPAVAEVTPVTVLATSDWEVGPAATADHLAWTVQGNVARAYAQPTGGARFKVNAAKTEGIIGGIDGASLVYTQFSWNDDISDVYVYDLVAHTRTRLPRPVNTTKQWESAGSISGDWLLFDRWWYPSNDTAVFLFNMSTQELRKVHVVTARQRWTYADQVNGSYAVFSTYAETSPPKCNVYLYDITAQTKTRVPNPHSRCQYAPSVDPTGRVYFARSGFGCGKHVVLRERSLTGAATTLYRFPDRRDLEQTYVLDNGDGTTDVYFDRRGCSFADSDIAKITVPA